MIIGNNKLRIMTLKQLKDQGWYCTDEECKKRVKEVFIKEVINRREADEELNNELKTYYKISMKKKIYVAGKVSGLNYEDVVLKFAKYESLLLDQGHDPIVPIYLCKKSDDWKTAMRLCIRALLKCDEIHMLPDWQDSEGARWEHEISIRLGIKIVYVELQYSRPECSSVYCDSPTECRGIDHCRHQ